MANTVAETPTLNPAFEAKIRKARWAVLVEQAWLRLWILFALVAVFFLFSLAGLWPLLGPTTHKIVLGLFGLALAGWLFSLTRIRVPSREDAIRRIEAVSGIPHRPASSYEDTLTASAEDPATRALWSAHRRRMAELIKRLRPGRPSPRTDRFDPMALRALVVLGTVLGVMFAGRGSLDSLADAFRFEDRAQLSDQRLDAWLTPPAYTGRPPLMLIDGSGAGGLLTSVAAAEPKPIEVPEKSLLIVRASGSARIPLALEVWPAGAREPAQTIEPRTDSSPAAGVTEVRTEITASATLKAVSGGTVLATWPITMIPDNAPGITLTKNPERTNRGALKLTYFVQDDYGVASADVSFTRAKDAGKGDPATAWARSEELKGPRPPFTRPPRLSLRLPARNAKSGEAFTYHEIGSHPWAGQRVRMTLEAKDVAGKVGRSTPLEIVLPERPFTKPLARALIEQRKLLIEDPRYADRVRTALDALTLAPDGFIDDPRVYLPLRSSVHRLGLERSRRSLDETIDQLWHTALRIEDGNLSDAEKNLRDIQERLAKALEEGASDEEIRKLMQELREAFQEYVQELQKQNADQDQANDDGQNGDQQQLSAEELDRMLREMEEMAKNGLRDQAKDMLAQMRDMMERMQQGRQSAEQQRQNKEMRDALKKLGEAVGEQQSIMNDTFEEGRQQQPGEGGERMRQTQPGQKGQRGQGMQADRGQMPNGMGDDQGEMGLRERGTDEGEAKTGGPQRRAELAERQARLREKLEAMRRDMQEKGLGDGEKLGDAAEAMQEAEEALRESDLEEANRQQARALDEMREGAQQMAEQMQQNGQQRAGETGDSPRDPMGRPQRSQGPDQGRSVKVPDQIDIQRAREVLEELRRRAGEARRPQIELDYIDRLLKWY